MAKPVLIKCRQCGKQVDKSTAIEVKTRIYVCSEQCHNEWKFAHEQKSKPVAEKSQMRQLTDYVQSYAPDTAWVKFGANVQRMCKDGMTVAGIHYTLRYMREHEQMRLDGDGLGLVQWYYDAAKQFYQWQQRMKKQVQCWQQTNNAAVKIQQSNANEEVFK